MRRKIEEILNSNPLPLKEQRRIFNDARKRLLFPKTAKFGRTFYKLLMERIVKDYLQANQEKQ